MAAELVNGFSIFIDGRMVAVETTFENAVVTANGHLATSPSTATIQIRSASSQVVRGQGASPQRTWNHDRVLSQWVELVR